MLLWMLDEYWYYSLFTLFMLVTFESTVVGQRLRNLKELRSLQTPKQPILVYRCVRGACGLALWVVRGLGCDGRCATSRSCAACRRPSSPSWCTGACVGHVG